MLSCLRLSTTHTHGWKKKRKTASYDVFGLCQCYPVSDRFGNNNINPINSFPLSLLTPTPRVPQTSISCKLTHTFSHFHSYIIFLVSFSVFASLAFFYIVFLFFRFMFLLLQIYWLLVIFIWFFFTHSCSLDNWIGYYMTIVPYIHCQVILLSENCLFFKIPVEDVCSCFLIPQIRFGCLFFSFFRFDSCLCSQ